MLTPTEPKAFECFVTLRKRETDLPKEAHFTPIEAVQLVRLYLEIRRCLLGGTVDKIVASDDRFELYVTGKGFVASTGFAWGYSGERPGWPIINFIFPQVGQNVSRRVLS